MADETIKIKQNGKTLLVNTSHLHQHSEMNHIINEAFSRFLKKVEDSSDVSFKLEIDFERIIGKTTCVQVSESDDIYYAQRCGRRTLTKFVKNKGTGEDCTTVTMIVNKTKSENIYRLITAYIGKVSEKEPLDISIKTADEFELAKNFWNSHALLHGSKKIYNNTITKECPWDTFENRPVIKIGNKNDISEIIKNLRQNQTNNNNLKIN